MTGEHQVIVRTNRLQFKFTLKRNITVLHGIAFRFATTFRFFLTASMKFIH